MGHLTNILPPHHAVARLFPKERLSVAILFRTFKSIMIGLTASPLLWGEEQGEGLECPRNTL